MAGSTLVLPCSPPLRDYQASEQQPRDALLLMSSRQPLSSPFAESRLGAGTVAPVWPAVRLRLGSEQAEVLPYHIPVLAETVREIASRHHPGQLIIDLTELAPGPFYQELACLCAVLRRILGPGIPIVLVNVNPAVAWSLASGYLPEGVTVAPIRRHPHRARATETASTAHEAIDACCACGRRIRLSALIAAQEWVICGVCGSWFRTESSYGPARHLAGAMGTA